MGHLPVQQDRGCQVKWQLWRTAHNPLPLNPLIWHQKGTLWEIWKSNMWPTCQNKHRDLQELSSMSFEYRIQIWPDIELAQPWGQSPFFIALQWEQLDGIKFSSWQQAPALSSVKFHCDLQWDTMAPQHPACTTLPIKWQCLSEKNLANWYKDMRLLYVSFVILLHPAACVRFFFFFCLKIKCVSNWR